ncbi:MAG: GntR family transcriptional regulator [Trueperaceae bacterium]|nr:MAG: GntR family transcriptional regulator [Trueperaceae bacterium]
MNTIDRTSPVPLYFQLKRILLAKIEQREWKPGHLIPSEHSLESSYGLSRITVRQALGELVNEGYLNRQRGRGTFVTRPKITHNPTHRLTLTDSMTQQGIDPGWRLLDTCWLEAPSSACQALELSPNTKVFCIRRLRLANDEPIGYHLAYVRESTAKHIAKRELEKGESLSYLMHILNVRGSKAYRTIEALAADADAAEQLKIAIGSPILHIQRTTVDGTGVPIEFLQASYRGDRFKYGVNL